MHIYYELTSQCNLNCKYCYNDSSMDKLDWMNYDQVCQAIARLKKDHNLLSMTLSGGEPLLHPAFENVVRLLHSLGINIVLITNGLLLKEYDPNLFSLFKCVQVSIHDNFETNVPVDSLENLAKRTKLVYNVVLNNERIYRIDEYERIARRTMAGVTYKIQRSEGRGKQLAPLTVDNALFIKKNYPSIFEWLFPISNAICCYFNRNYDVYTMHPNGGISLCASLPNKYVLGNVFEDWYSRKDHAIFMLKEDITAYREKVCKKCVLFNICEGLCPGNINIDDFTKSLYCHVKCRLMLERIINKC